MSSSSHHHHKSRLWLGGKRTMERRRGHGVVVTDPHHTTAGNTLLLPQRWLRPALLLLACYLLGYLHGSGLGNMTPMLVVPSSSSLNAAAGMTTATNSNNRNDSGWTSLDVFYGTRDYLQTQNRTWFSQARQDELITKLLYHKPRGYFIDLAANDAVQLSNSLALERAPYHWQGLCIEPNPMYWKNLTYRSCQTVGAVVGAQRDEQVYFRFQAGEYGGIAAEGFDNNARWQRQSQPQSTVTLHEIFQRYQVPRDIDYLSLDVEGAETFIMMAFPLHEYRIKLLTAERLRGEIRHFLKNHSYEFVQRLTRWGESLWVHKDFKPFMNWTALEDFDYPMF